MNTTAYLSNDGEYTYFYIGDRVVTFLTRKSLEQYKKIVEWDNGYLVVMCKNKNENENFSKNYAFKNQNELEEDYIDLIPIFENLYMDPKKYLSGIERVELRYE